jgi:hypothetical protein
MLPIFGPLSHAARRHRRCGFSSRLRHPGGLGPRCRVLLALVFALLPLSLFLVNFRAVRGQASVGELTPPVPSFGFLLPGSSPVFCSGTRARARQSA